MVSYYNPEKQNTWRCLKRSGHQGLTWTAILRHNYFCKDFIYFQREGMGGRKRGRETMMWDRNINWLPLKSAPTRDRTCNPNLCPDRKSNWWHFTSRDNARPTEPEPPWSGQDKTICYWQICEDTNGTGIFTVLVSPVPYAQHPCNFCNNSSVWYLEVRLLLVMLATKQHQFLPATEVGKGRVQSQTLRL